MRNTMRKVTIVVPVLMTSCQVSLKWKSGPLTAHATITKTAMPKVTGCPEARAVALAKRVKDSEIGMVQHALGSGDGLWPNSRGTGGRADGRTDGRTELGGL